ncbi:hypothetical protein [uncultured Sphingomonas sp.]|uniref:hypothetical protein n=1 Tax=uncultured Sphingomonas sp. TaxID=158754 RepID=UPI0025E00D98|nr:hypothetical protein [uncultured Sphingomonas sp.]
MRPDLSPAAISAIGAPTITTFIAASLAFKSEVCNIWTGICPLTPKGYADSLLEGKTFDPLVAGLVIDISANTFTLQGSNELTITLNIPTDANVAVAAANVYPNEYQGREAVLWRVIKLEQPNVLDEPVWHFSRIRSGSMDKVEIQADGQSNKFILTIESHQSRVSNASNQTYLNQRSYDPNDTSQDYAVSIANGDPAPSKRPVASGYANSAASFGGVGKYFLDRIAQN